MEKFVGSKTIDHKTINKNIVYVPLDCQQWTQPGKMSLFNLEEITKPKININFKDCIDDDTLILDPKTLKISVNKDIFSSKIHNIDLDCLNNNASPTHIKHEEKDLFFSVDDNYLYVYIEKLNKWKKILILD